MREVSILEGRISWQKFSYPLCQMLTKNFVSCKTEDFSCYILLAISYSCLVKANTRFSVNINWYLTSNIGILMSHEPIINSESFSPYKVSLREIFGNWQSFERASAKTHSLNVMKYLATLSIFVVIFYKLSERNP